MDKLVGPTELKFYNPLKARIGHAVTIDRSNGATSTSSSAIREYKHSIGNKDFFFVDYMLLARPLHGERLVVRIRLNPVDDPERYGGLTHHALLLRLDDEFAYNEEFQRQVLTDNSGKFQVLQDGQVKEEFFRINDVTSVYKARVAILEDLNHDKKVDRDEVQSRASLEYWDYWPRSRTRPATGPAAASDTAEIYEPPYLFKGPRPTIGSAPSTIKVGASFGVADTRHERDPRRSRRAPGRSPTRWT